MKKFLCEIMVLFIILVSFYSNVVKAKNNDDEFLKEAVFNHLCLEDKYNEKASYHISDEIIRYSYKNEEYIEITNVKMFIVYKNYKPIILVESYGNTIKVMSILDEKKQELIGDCQNMVALEKDGLTYLVTKETIIGINNTTDDYSLLELKAYTDKLSIPTLNTNLIDFSTVNVTATYNWAFPVRGQYPYLSGCWAACIASFDSFYKGTNTTTNNVVYDITGSYNQVTSKSISQVRSYLQYYYDIITSIRSVNSSFASAVRNDLANRKGYILLWQQTKTDNLTGEISTGYHFTILKGYEVSGNAYSYYIMDPNDEGTMYGTTYTIATNSSTSFPTMTTADTLSTIVSTVYSSLYFGYINTDTK